MATNFATTLLQMASNGRHGVSYEGWLVFS